jgi:hypothetical protein
MSSARANHHVALFSLLSLAFFVLTAGVLQAVRSELDPLQHTLSHYLVGPGGRWLCAAYVLQGAAIMLLGLRLARQAPGAHASFGWLPALLFVFCGLGLAGVAIVDLLLPSCDPAAPGWYHHMFATVAIGGALCGQLVQSMRFVHSPGWLAASRPAAALAALSVLLVVMHLSLPGWPRGLGQKLLILSILAWLALASTALLQRRALPAAGKR